MGATPDHSGAHPIESDRELIAALSSLLLVHDLFSYTQTIDDFAVTVGILAIQIIQQSPTLTDHLQQTSPGVIILPVHFEVLSEVIDALRQQSDLNLRRACVSRMLSVLFNYLPFSFFG
jgi:hypothetical protein